MFSQFTAWLCGKRGCLPNDFQSTYGVPASYQSASFRDSKSLFIRVIILFRSLVLPCVFPLLFHVLVLSNTQLLPFSFIGPFLVIKLFLFSSFPLVHIVANYSRSIFGSILHCRVVAKVVVSAQLCSKSPRLIMSGIADIIVGILC